MRDDTGIAQLTSSRCNCRQKLKLKLVHVSVEMFFTQKLWQCHMLSPLKVV
jgi:hypothetical protein